jgi:hypothetical protein
MDPVHTVRAELKFNLKAAEDRNADGPRARLGRLDRPAGGRVLGEPQVCAPRVVVVLLAIAKQAHRKALWFWASMDFNPKL